MALRLAVRDLVGSPRVPGREVATDESAQAAALIKSSACSPRTAVKLAERAATDARDLHL